jgi:predicted DCC family thiol-disulfide oxidoreductase YuxK
MVKKRHQVSDIPKAADRSDNPAVATVFYDGQCPLCSREINHYRRLRGSDRVSWIDISTHQAALEAHQLQRDTAMARLHVRDASGQWHTGAWGFAELWSHLPAYRWLAKTMRALRLLPALDRIYSRFAHWRFQRRCDADSCHTG